MRALGLIFAVSAALSVAAPAAADVINYNITGTGTGTMTLDLTGGVYTLDTLNLTLGSATFTQADSTLAPASGSNYVLGTTAFGGPPVAKVGTNTFWAYFNPTLATQTTQSIDWGNVGALTLEGGSLTFTQVAASVPEPSTWAMMLLEFGGLAFAVRRKCSHVLATA